MSQQDVVIRTLAVPNPFAATPSNKFGDVLFPKKILAANLVNFSPSEDFKKKFEKLQQVHGKEYDFHIIELPVTINPGENWLKKQYRVQSIEVRGHLNPDEQDSDLRPMVVSTFPSTEFVDGESAISLRADIAFDVGTLLPKFIPVKAEAKVGIEYKYQSRIAKVSSGRGVGSDGFFWRFEKTPQDYPLGEMGMWSIAARPRKADKIELLVTGEAHFLDPVFDLVAGTVPIPPALVRVHIETGSAPTS